MSSCAARLECHTPNETVGHDAAVRICVDDHGRDVWTRHGSVAPEQPGEPGGPWIPANPRLAALAEQIRRHCTPAPARWPRCPSGLAALDAALGGGFARGAIHELLAPWGGAAAHTVALLTATRAADRQRWIFYIDTRQDFYPPGAAQLGVPLERLVVIRAVARSDALWVCEQTLRCRSVAAVVLPLRSLEAYASRRLQLAAEAGGNLGLLVGSDEAGGRTFAATRLRFEPLVGEPGTRRMSVSILKLRGSAVSVFL